VATPDGVWLIDPLALPISRPLAPSSRAIRRGRRPRGRQRPRHLKRRYDFAFRSIFEHLHRRALPRGKSLVSTR